MTVSVKSEKSAEYRLILYAVENGLKYQQNDGGIYRDYTHNHVVRKLLSATVDGDKLGHIAASCTLYNKSAGDTVDIFIYSVFYMFEDIKKVFDIDKKSMNKE